MRPASVFTPSPWSSPPCRSLPFPWLSFEDRIAGLSGSQFRPVFRHTQGLAGNASLPGYPDPWGLGSFLFSRVAMKFSSLCRGLPFPCLSFGGKDCRPVGFGSFRPVFRHGQGLAGNALFSLVTPTRGGGLGSFLCFHAGRGKGFLFAGKSFFQGAAGPPFS